MHAAIFAQVFVTYTIMNISEEKIPLMYLNKFCSRGYRQISYALWHRHETAVSGTTQFANNVSVNSEKNER